MYRLCRLRFLYCNLSGICSSKNPYLFRVSPQFVDFENYPSRSARSACWNDGQADETGFAFCVVHALGGFDIVFRTSKEDVGDKCLRVAIIKREPARLNLHHDAVTGQKDVVSRW